MKREILIEQVKNEYAGIASSENQHHFHQTTTGLTPQAYYETLQEMVIAEIKSGTFDRCKSGLEIVKMVEADKHILSEWENRKFIGFQ